MKDKIQEIINQIGEQKKKEVAAFKMIQSLLQKYEKQKKLTTEDLKKIQGLTCYDDLAFCCGIQKACYFRDSALHMLNISKKEFQSKKSELTQAWIKVRTIGETNGKSQD